MITDKLRDLIKSFEGLKLTVYLDMAYHKTVGYGHKDDSMTLGDTVTQAQADALLDKDIQTAIDQTTRLIKVDLNQNQLDALTDFTYNLGCTRLQDSTLLKFVNGGGSDDEIKAEFLKWDHSGGVTVSGLLRRRQMEVDLFFSES